MKHPITHIGVREGQNGFLHAVITFVFQWQIKAPPRHADEVTSFPLENSERSLETGPRPSACARNPFFS